MPCNAHRTHCDCSKRPETIYPALPLPRPHSHQVTEQALEIIYSELQWCPVWCACPALGSIPFPHCTLSLLPSSPAPAEATTVPGNCLNKQIQWITMTVSLELPFQCWDGHRFIDADSGWYLGMDNYLQLLEPTLLYLSIYCPDGCPFPTDSEHEPAIGN